METLIVNEILSLILTYAGSALVATIPVLIQHRKNKAVIEQIRAEAEKASKEGNAAEGDIFLKWTQEFKASLAEVERKNTLYEDLFRKQEEMISNLNTVLIDAKARIVILEQENGELKETVLALQNENDWLKGRISDLEEENASLRKMREERNGE